MTDLATLGIRVQSQEAEAAENRLDGMAMAADRAEVATSELAQAARGLAQGLTPSINAVQQSITAQTEYLQQMFGLRAAQEAQRDADARAAQAARESASALKAEEQAAAALAQRVTSLKASTDPLGAALDRVNRELEEALSLYRLGAIGQEQFEQSTTVLTQRLDVLRQQQTRVRAGMGLTAAEGLNMGRQLTDVGVQMAMGMNPFMIAVQQGPQILDIFQMAAIRTGTSVSAAMRAMGAAIWTAMAPVLPIIAAIGAAAGAVWGGWSLTTRSLTKDIGDLTEGIGLSEDQMKRLAETGTSTTATAGDAFRGLGTTIKEVFQEAFGPQLDWVSSRFSEAMDWLTRVGGNAVKAFVGNWMGAFKAITATWRQIPNVIGDATFTAVSFVVEGIQKMINAGIDGINALLAAARALGPLSPLGAAAQGVGNLNRVNLGVDNPFRGAMSAFGLDARGAFAEGQALGNAVVDGFMDRWRANTRASGQARILDAVGTDGAQRASGARVGQEARGETIQLSRRTNLGNGDPLRILSDDLITPLEMLADELRLIDGLARETSRGLSSAFGESGRALRDLLTVTTAYQSRLAEIALAQEQNRLTGAQADRERAQAQIGAYGDMTAAARGFFKEGSDGYQVLLAAEQAFRLVQLAGMLQAMVTDTAFTGTSIGNSLARGAALAAEGAARMFAMLGPYAFPVVAAMTALLLSMGIRSGGGRSSGGGGSFNPGPINDGSMQRAQLATGGGMVRQAVNVVVSTNDDRFNAYVDERTQPYTDTRTAQGVSASRQASSADRRRSDRLRLGGRTG